jgi:hypothetical protein
MASAWIKKSLEARKQSFVQQKQQIHKLKHQELGQIIDPSAH